MPAKKQPQVSSSSTDVSSKSSSSSDTNAKLKNTITFSQLVNEKIDLDENENLKLKNWKKLKSLFSSIDDKKQSKQLEKFYSKINALNMDKREDELTISENQDLLFLLVKAALAHKDDPKIKAFLLGEAKKNEKVDEKSFNINLMKYLRKQNNKRTEETLFDLMSLDKGVKIKALNKLIEQPNAFIGDPESEFLKFKISVFKKNKKTGNYSPNSLIKNQKNS